MPTNVVTSETMQIGKEGGGKHWTDAEIAARQTAANAAKRKTKVRLTAPKWLSAEALVIWNQTLKQAKGLDILDNIDATLLAVYCDTYVKYRDLSQPKLDEEGQPKQDFMSNDDVKALQAYVRIISQLTDKLGFSPAARARLVKKKADAILDNFGKKFD